MRNKSILLVLLGAFAVTFAVYEYRGVKHHSWVSLAPAKTHAMAAFIETYHLEVGAYPTSLADLVTNADFSSRNRDSVMALMSSSQNFHFDCRFDSNEFVITVTNPNRGDETFVEKYKHGELLQRHKGQ
jgi:hypothetical protein